MTLTDTAISRVNDMAVKETLTDCNLRISVVGGGCSGYSYEMGFEDKGSQQLNDFIFEYDNFKVHVDAMSFQFLDGTTVDYIESFQFSGFNFINPNAKQTCGCGSSFGV